ncbi:50S ribosomal protein L25/general stress protein Ctc [Maribellus maritimus]|uniref:50S ribosomal protein L25/general stress protein Ctc n=1 Tax=Maribellus maritimus TaxID=2870838 RepID=UPI001EEBC75E|nr:50S ribosomal protein L25/general stress protein Ctc [Maribellus maritimus]MCG6188401.1 50S ribosomal protein L25/general stress protein Ctc [Maribellus maritimus]
MKSVTIKGQVRESLGKKEAKKLRAEELVPAVLYGGEDVLHFTIPFSELRKLIYTPSVYLVDIDIDGKTHQAIMQDIQWHPVEEVVLHVDFMKVVEGKPVKIAVPVKLNGLARGVKSGGKLKQNLRLLKVKALAENLPDVINVDITKLAIGQSIKVADLKVENIEFLDSKSNMVVSVITSRAAKAGMGTLPEDEEDEAAEGETAEGEATETQASEE